MKPRRLLLQGDQRAEGAGSHQLQRSEQEVQQLWGGGVGDVAAQPGLCVGEVPRLARGPVTWAVPLPHDPGPTCSHQQAEGVLDFLKHGGVLGLGGRLGPQRQETLCR